MSDSSDVLNPHEASVDRYFERCGYTGSRDCTLDTLKKIMWCHYKSFPFENLSMHIKQPIIMELKAIEEKFIDHKRGGYCFEHATLLHSILKQLGFNVSTLIGRVIVKPGDPISPNTHGVLMVIIDDQKWMVDCWFGPYGSTVPLLISDEAIEHQTMTCPHRLTRNGDVYTHQAQSSEHTGMATDGWEDLYTFTLAPAYIVDYQVASWFVETHPESFFMKNILLGKFWEDKRCMMFNQYFKYRAVGPGSTDADLEKRVITSQEEYLSVLKEYFELTFPEGTVICPPGVKWI